MATKKRLTQQERRQSTRASLLKAARKIFGRRGYNAASLDEIAEEAGLSKGALYYNFAGKGELFLALLDERMDDRIQDIERIFTAGPATERATEAQVREAALHAIQTLKQSRAWRLLFLEFVTHAARDPNFGAQFATRFKTMRAALTTVVEQRASELEFELPIPAEQVAIAVNALGNGLAIEELATPDGVPDELFGLILSYVFQGMVAAREGGPVAPSK